MKTWFSNGLCEIILERLQDHTGLSGPKIRSKGWNWSTEGVIDLIEGEKGIKGKIFFEFDAIIPMRSLAEGDLGQETGLELGLAISRDPTVGFASNLKGH